MPPKYSEEEKQSRLKAFNELCPAGPSFDADGKALCPKCNEGVDLGAVGLPVLYLNHMDTKICAKAQKKAKKASTTGMKTILSFWGTPKPKPALVSTTSTAPAIICAQAIGGEPINLNEGQHDMCSPTSVTTPAVHFPPPRDFDQDGGLTYASALETLRYHSRQVKNPSPDQENTFLRMFDQPPELFDSDPTLCADEIWEQWMNSELHKAFGTWGDELDEADVTGLKVERVLGFVEFTEYFVRRGLDASLFKERARRLVKGIDKWRVTTHHEPEKSVECRSASETLRGQRRGRSVEMEKVPDVDGCCFRRTPELPEDGTGTTRDDEGLRQQSEHISLANTPTPSPCVTSQSTTLPLAQCIGHQFDVPPGISPHAAYPFALHDKISLPWRYTVDNGRMVLHHRGCSGLVGTVGIACHMCRNLARNNILTGIVERMSSGVKEGTNWAYYGMGALHELLRLKSRQIEHYRLRHLNHARKLAGKVAALDDHKRFLTAVASKHVERVDRVIRLGLKQGRGIKGLLRQYLKAATGLYKPKSFEEEDYLRGLVLWKLGGNRIASIAHRALGLPSITTLRNQIRIPPC